MAGGGGALPSWSEGLGHFSPQLGAVAPAGPGGGAAAPGKENPGGLENPGGGLEKGAAGSPRTAAVSPLAANSPNVTPRSKARRQSMPRRGSPAASPACAARSGPAAAPVSARPGAAQRVGLQGSAASPAPAATPRSRLRISTAGQGPAPEVFAATRRLAAAMGGDGPRPIHAAPPTPASPWATPARRVAAAPATGSPVRVRVHPVCPGPAPGSVATAASPAARALGFHAHVDSPATGSPVRVRVRVAPAAGTDSPATAAARGSAEALLAAAEAAATGAGAGMSPLVGAVDALGAAASAVSQVKSGSSAGGDSGLEDLRGRVEAVRRRLKHRTTVAFHEASVGCGPGTPGRLKSLLRELSAEPEARSAGVTPVQPPRNAAAQTPVESTPSLASGGGKSGTPTTETPGSVAFEFGFAGAPTPPTPVMMPSPETPAAATPRTAPAVPRPTALATVLAHALKSAADEAAAAERGLQAAKAATPIRLAHAAGLEVGGGAVSTDVPADAADDDLAELTVVLPEECDGASQDGEAEEATAEEAVPEVAGEPTPEDCAQEDSVVLGDMEDFFGDANGGAQTETVAAETTAVAEAPNFVTATEPEEVGDDTGAPFLEALEYETAAEQEGATTVTAVSGGREAAAPHCEGESPADAYASPLGFTELFAGGPVKRVGSALRARANGAAGGGTTTQAALGLIQSPGGMLAHPEGPSPGAGLRFRSLAEEQDDSDAADALAAEERCRGDGAAGASAAVSPLLVQRTPGLRRAFPRGTPGAVRMRSQDAANAPRATAAVSKSNGGSPLGSVAALTPVRASAVGAGAAEAEELVATPVRRSARHLRARSGSSTPKDGTPKAALSSAGYSYAPNPNFPAPGSPAAAPGASPAAGAAASAGRRRSSRLARRDP